MRQDQSPPVTAPSYIVVDIGGTNLRFGRVDRAGQGEVLSAVSARCLESNPVAVLAAHIADLSGASRPAGIVVGIPGPLDAARRTVVDAPNIPSLHGLPLADQLAEATGLPVWLEHDGALLLLGEQAAGSAAGQDLVLGVFFGTGIGAAFLEERPAGEGRRFCHAARPYSRARRWAPVRMRGRRLHRGLCLRTCPQPARAAALGSDRPPLYRPSDRRRTGRGARRLCRGSGDPDRHRG